MKIHLAVLAAVALFASTAALAETEALSAALAAPRRRSPRPSVTGSPGTIFEVIAVVPVGATVTGAPALMAGSVTLPSAAPLSFCGAGSAICSSDLWAAQ